MNKEPLNEWGKVWEVKMRRSPRYWWEYWKLRISEWRHRRWWYRNFPAEFYTFYWDEHPEDWDDPCICRECRSYMSGE